MKKFASCRHALVAASLLTCSTMSASAQLFAQCAVQPFSIPYLGSNTSTSMTAASGQPCTISPAVGGTNIMTGLSISVPASNGSAVAGADTVTYQSQPGFTGSDSFTFILSGSGPAGSGSSAVQVQVTVR